MKAKKSDAEMIASLLERLKLVVAVSDDVAIENKLQIQPMLKDLAGMLESPESAQDQARVGAYFSSLLEASEEDPNAMALLGAVRNFVSYL